MADSSQEVITSKNSPMPGGLRALRLLIRFTLAMIIMAGAVFHAGCAKDKPVTLRIGTNVWPGYEPLYLARSLGFYENAGIKLVEYPSTSSVIRAYKNNVIEVAAVTMDEALLLAEDDRAGHVILIADFSNGADAVIAKPGIDSISALKGKRVGVETTALGAYMLSRSLESAGLSPKDVSVDPIEINKHENAFKDGLVDAVVTFDPVREKLVAAGGKSLFDSSQMPGEIVDVLYISRDVLDKNGEAVNALVRGWFRALDYLQKNPADAARRVASREKMEPDEYLNTLKGIRFPGIKENLALLSGSDPAFLRGAKTLAKVMKEKNLLRADIDPARLVNQSVVSRASQ
ncbi:MAG: ABC transporter substrate-binding protein [Nitrospinae bacterium]|nr:ABC transporter substrate-binding protein [Nitrospinota bacterium]